MGNNSTKPLSESELAKPTCECGNSMVNVDKSTPQWEVYDCICSKCGSRSPQAAAQVRAIVMAGVRKGSSK